MISEIQLPSKIVYVLFALATLNNKFTILWGT